ncbi:hypothetical protein EV121DRAFT_256995 [Schizophyllum commune]
MAKSKKERKKDATAASAAPVTLPEKDDGAGVVGSVPPPAGASYDPWAGTGNNTPDVPTPQAIPAPGIAGWSVPPTPSMPTGAPSPVMMSRPVSNASKQGAWQSWGQESRSSKAGGWGSAGGAPAQTAGGWTAAFAGDGWNHYDEEEESSDEEEYPTGYVPHSHNVLGGGGHQPLSRGHQSAPTNAWMSWGKTPVDAPPQPPPSHSRAPMTPQQRSQTLNALLSQPASPGIRPPQQSARRSSAFTQAKSAPPPPPPPATDKKAKRQTGFFGGWGKSSKKPEPPAPAPAAGGWGDAAAAWGSDDGGWGADAGAGGGWGDAWGTGNGKSAQGNGGGGGWDEWGASGVDNSWPTNTIWEEDEEEDITGTPRKVHFTPSTPGSSGYGGDAGHDFMSKTLAYASSPRGSLSDRANKRFVESNGAALMPVQRALFGRSRPAKDRIHWGFPPGKNVKVATVLNMVHHLSHSIADFGISKFLAAGVRGALFINATYRHPGHPDEPAFDWLTFPQLQQTLDFTLQDSVAFSDPAKVVVVFVFLSSESGNSVAMWRVKLKVPPDVLAMRGQAIEELKASLPAREKYVIFLEPGEGPPARAWRNSSSSQQQQQPRPTRRLSKKGSLKGKNKREGIVMPPTEGLIPHPPAKKKKKWYHMFKIRWS